MPSNRIQPGGPRPRLVTIPQIRSQLRNALAQLEGEPSPAQVRAAHGLALRASTGLESRVARLARQDADAHRAHAIKQARNLKDARGYRRASATMPGYHIGRPNPSKGKKFRATPPNVNDVLRMFALSPTLTIAAHGECPSCAQGSEAGQHHLIECVNPHSERRRALMILLWRSGLRIGCEALKLTEADLHPDEGYIYVAKGKNGNPRIVGLDDWVWPYLAPWLQLRQAYPPGPLFCVIEGPTAGRAWNASSFRRELHALASLAGVRTRVAPHQLRHAAALGQKEDGIDSLIISRNLGHSSLAVTDIYFRGMQQSEVVKAIRARPMPKISMLEALRNEGVKPRLPFGGDLLDTLRSGQQAKKPTLIA